MCGLLRYGGGIARRPERGEDAIDAALFGDDAYYRSPQRITTTKGCSRGKGRMAPPRHVLQKGSVAYAETGVRMNSYWDCFAYYKRDITEEY